MMLPAGSEATQVTEFCDCSRSPVWPREAVRGGERWREAMMATLANPARLITSGS
jgi:hypothetical protein